MTLTAENDTEPDRPSDEAVVPKEKRPRLAPGTTIGHAYTIRSFHRRGGMAEIYLGYHDHMMREVAIKVLQEEHERKPHIVRGLQREARALAAIPNHPNLVQIFDSGVDPDTKMPFVVMEVLLGKDLREMIVARGEAYPIDEAVAIIITVSRTLTTLHDVGIFHRDLKPENIFIQYKGKGQAPVIKLLDLGAALTPARLEVRTEEDNRCIGTPLYMSPEQITRGVITPASDMYALGHILYELLRGKHAFGEVDIDPGNSAASYVRVQLFRQVEPLAECVPDMPEELSSIVDRMLQKDPNDRFPSMPMLTEVLVDFVKRFRAGGTDQPGFLERMLASQASAEERHRGRKRSGEVATGKTQDRLDAQTTEPDGAAGAVHPRRMSSLPSANAIAPRLIAPSPIASIPTTPSTHVSEKLVAANVTLTEKEQLTRRGTVRIELNSTPVALPPTAEVRARLLTAAALPESVAKAFAEEEPDVDGIYPRLLVHLQGVLPATEAVLGVDSFLIVDGPRPLLGLRYPIGFAALKLGRDPLQVDLPIPHRTVSQQHCGIFAVNEGLFEVIDSGSSFGIEVNDLPGTRGLLRPRGRLRLGEIVLEYVTAGVAPSDPRKPARGSMSSISASVHQLRSVAPSTEQTYARKAGRPGTVPSSRQIERMQAQRASQSQLAPSPATLTAPPAGAPPAGAPPSPTLPVRVAPIFGSAPGAPMVIPGLAAPTFGSPPSAAPSREASAASPPKEEGPKPFVPPETALRRAGKDPRRLEMALQTHEYIELAQDSRSNRADLERLRVAVRGTVAIAWAKMWRSRTRHELAENWFALNELTARFELLGGGDARAVFERLLATPADWFDVVQYTVAAKSGYGSKANEERARAREEEEAGLVKSEREARDRKAFWKRWRPWVVAGVIVSVFLVGAAIGYTLLAKLGVLAVTTTSTVEIAELSR